MKTKLAALLVLLAISGSLLAQVNRVPIVSGVLTLDVERYSKFKVTVDQNVTSVVLNPSVGVPNGNIFTVLFIQNSIGGFSVTFGGNISNPCTVNTTANVSTSCSFQFDSDSNTWFGISGGGAGTPSGNSGQTQVNNAGAFGGAACQNFTNKDTGPINNDCDTRFKGPNPYIDVTRYGVRGGSASTTATTTPGQPTVTLAAASTFQNGDGVVIYGAGAAHAMSTPSAPTVTQSVARVMTGTGDVVTGPTGATTYNYKIIARNINGGLTAASTAGITTTGQASLGSQTVNITSCTRSGFTVTCTTAAAHTLITGAMVYIPVNSNSLSDNSFSGWYQVNGSTDNTHFSFTSGMTTSNGASTSATGGIAFWFNCNHVTWSPVTGAYQYYIYSDRAAPGTFALVGVSKPNNPLNGNFTDGTLYWDDFGSPMMDNLTAIPGNIPALAPSVATSNNLVTTIVSGAGTTTLTLAANAGTSVSGVSIKFDNAPNIVTAATAAGSTPLYFPVGTPYAVNSVLDLSGFSFASLVTPGGLTLNDTLIMKFPMLRGSLFPVTGTLTQFQFESYPVIACNAIPCFFVTNGTGGRVEGLQFSGSGNNDLLILQDAGGSTPGAAYERVALATSSNSSDYMGMAFMGRGIPGSGSFLAQFRKILAVSGPNQTNGVTATPLIYFYAAGATISIDSIFLNRRGILYRADTAGGNLRISWADEQGGITPFTTYTGNLIGTGNAGMNATLRDIVLDTTSHPLAAYLPSQGGLFVGLNPLNAGHNSGGADVSGNAFSGGVGGLSGQNIGSGLSVSGTSGQIGTQLGGNTTATAVPVVGSLLSAPVAPVCVVAAGGSVPIGAHTERIDWIDAFGNTSLLGATCSVTTTGGNQTINVTPASVPVGAVSYNVYRDSVLTGIGSGNCPPISVSATFSDTLGFSNPCTSQIQSISSAVAAGIGPNSVATPSLVLTGGGFTSTTSGTFTAGRTVVLPDNSGILPVTGYLNSAYDNANRANGAIGANWTLTKNTLSITSNTIQGGSAAAENIAFYSALPFFTGQGQFAQLTVTATDGVNGGSGVTVMTSAGDNAYICGENTTTLILLKRAAGVNTTINSTAVTGLVGDVLRIEIATGGALSCSQTTAGNVKTTITGNDTALTSGAPGIRMFSNVATSDNWSGGNLHPIAQLDTEQDWTQPQHGLGFFSDRAALCTNAELALSAGWQSTGAATVTAVAGLGLTCSWTITTGTTTAANPTVTDTLTLPLPSALVCEMNIHGGTHTAVAGEAFQQTTLSATAPVFTANFTPTAAGTTYFVTRRCGP